MARRLFVGNLPYTLNEDELLQAFAKYGATSAHVVEGRGFGFVEVEDGDAAIAEMNEAPIAGRKAIVSEARPREGGGGGGGGGRGFGGGGGGGGGRGGGYDRDDRRRGGGGSRW